MRMSRIRKVVSMQKGHLSKEQKAAMNDGEKAVKANSDALSAPDWLSDTAALEFERVVREAKTVGMLDNLDLSVLAVYADNYSRYVQAATYMNIHGPLVTMKTGYEQISPWLTVLNQSAKNIFTCSTKLALAVTDRLKLIVPTKEEKSVNKYIKFLGDGTNA